MGKTGPERRGHESILLAVVVPSHPGGVPIVRLGGRMAAEAVLADLAGGRPRVSARIVRLGQAAWSGPALS